MSIQNFIPTLWAESMIREMDKAHKFVQDCVRDYEGQLKKMGDKVVIPMLTDPVIKTMALADRNKEIEAPDFLSDTSIEVKADHVKYFNFAVSDIDAVQSKYGAMDEAQRRAAQLLADEHDKLVASLVTGSDAAKLFDSPMKVVEGTATSGEINVLRLIDLAAQRLYEDDVPDSEKIVATIPPALRTLIKSEYLDKSTSNEKMMANGYIGSYGGVMLRVSNNVHNGGTSGAPQHNIMVRTMDAVAFVEQLSEVKAYQPEKLFGDAVKGMSLFGAKIIRPKKLVVANITY